MMKLPVVTGEKMAKIVSKLDFIMVHQKGSHQIWKHDDGRITTIPIHPGKNLSKGLIRQILNDIDLSVQEFIKLVRK